LVFTLTGAAMGGSIHAGEPVTYTYTVTDAYGGPVINPLEVIPSWPGAVVFDDGISGNGQILGFTRVGDFTITARATGATGVNKVEPLQVLAAAGQRYVTMGLTLSRMATNDTTLALTVVKDLYGNVIIDDTNGTSTGLTLTCTAQNPATPATACSKTGNEFTITKSGVYKIMATFNDGTNPAATATEYVFVEDVPDVEPPTAHIDTILYPGNSVQVPRQGRIDAQLTMTDNRGLNTAVLYAVFGDTPACRANSVTLLLTGSLTNTTSASLTVPTCAFPGDSIMLVVQAQDMAGNDAFSPTNTTLSVSTLQLGNLMPAGTATVDVVGVLGNNFSAGADLAFDAASETAYLVDNNNQRITVVLPDRTTATLKDATGQNYQTGQNPAGIALSPQGDLFIGRWNTGTIAHIPPTLPTQPAQPVTGLTGPGRLVYDARPTTPVVCAAKTGSNASMNCYAFNTATNPVLTELFNNDVVPNPAPTNANQELVGVAVGARDAGGNYQLWLLYGGCALYSTTALLDTTQPATPTLVTVTGGFQGGGSTCSDIAALPNGDVVVLDTQQRALVRVTSTGTGTATGANLVTGFSQPTGLDVAGGNVYVLDRNLIGNGAILRVTP
jgi:hypothetical protein